MPSINEALAAERERSRADRTIIVPAFYVNTGDAELTLSSANGESGDMALIVDGKIVAKGEGFHAAQLGPSLLEMSDAQLAGMFGSFLAHALESSESGARDGWSVLTDEASNWTDALHELGESESEGE